MPTSKTVFKTINDALSKQAKKSFEEVVTDIEQHVLPTMASLAAGFVVIGDRLREGIYTDGIAQEEKEALIDAACAVIVRFANRILKEIQDILNALLDAVAQVVNGALGVKLL